MNNRDCRTLPLVDRRPQLARRLPSLVLLALLSLVSTAVTAQSADPCSFINQVTVNTDDKESFKSSFKKAVRDLANAVFADDFLLELEESQRDLQMTRHSGFAFILNCSDLSADNRLKRTIRFGPGLVVQPVAQRKFNGDVNYIYGRTEYGLLVFVREFDLIPIKDDIAYFFPDSTLTVDLCRKDGTECGDPRQIDSRTRYARMRVDDLKTASNPSKCGPFRVAIYDGRTTEPKRQMGAWLNLCDDGGKPIVKVVTAAKFERLFSQSKPSGAYVYLMSAALRDKIPFLLSKKPCKTDYVLKSSASLSLGGSINGELDIVRFVAASADAGVTAEFKVEENIVFAKDDFVMFGNYTIKRPDSDTTIMRDAVVLSKCAGLEPSTEAEDVALDHSLSEDGQTHRMSLDSAELKTKFVKRTGSSAGLYMTATDAARGEGKFWAVLEHRQYLLWRGLLRDEVARELQGRVPSSWDADRKRAIQDFYAHLFMAVSFDFLDGKDAAKYIEEELRWD